MDRILNLINGQLVPPIGGSYLDNYNPATGKKYSLVPASKENDVAMAIEAAQKSFPAWKRLTKKERANYLRLLASGIESRMDEFALAECLDSGKPLKLARQVDIPRSVLNLRYFADELEKFDEEAYSDIGSGENVVHYSPLGVVTCISPWNLPLYLLTWKIAPALAAGNTVVAKPSEVTPMTAYLFSQVCQEIKLPAGVLNIIHGKGPDVGPTLCTHPLIKAVSFTGSTRTGKEIIKLSAPLLKKVSLEMGGKNPTIVFADCDLDKAVSTSVRAAFTNQGQICLCGSRLFVEKNIYQQFKEKFLEKVRELKVGNPLEESSNLGALVSKEHFEKVQGCVERAKSEGGVILHGGTRVLLDNEMSEGYFYPPTVIENLSPYCSTNQEEIFGPVVALMSFETEEEVIEWSNSTNYGLSASIWTLDLAKAKRVACQIDSGVVWINTWMLRDLRTPFGGVKESGLGREGGKYSLRFFSEMKNICTAID